MSTQTHRDQLKGKILEMKTSHEQRERDSSEEISSLKNQVHVLHVAVHESLRSLLVHVYVCLINLYVQENVEQNLHV